MVRVHSFTSKPTGVHFRFDETKAIAAVVYLACKAIEALDKYKLSKLLFLADKFHLVQYARPITGDEYFALPYGPVPSAILNSLNAVISEEETILTGKLQVDRNFLNPHFSATREESFLFSALSKSDIAALDYVAEKYGNKSFPELKSMTHEMPAYENAWNNRGNANRARMKFEDFFEEDADAIGGVIQLMIENADFF
jgi:uncharacterized phage-associated protein